MHIESENYDFLMYTLNAGQPVPSLYPVYITVLGDHLHPIYMYILSVVPFIV